MHGVEGSGVEAGSEAFDQLDGAVRGWIPGNRVAKPCANFEFLCEDLPGFAAGVAGAADEGAAGFEFGEAADEERKRSPADVSFGSFGLAGDVEMEGGKEVRVEVVHRCSCDRSSSTGFVLDLGWVASQVKCASQSTRAESLT